VPGLAFEHGKGRHMASSCSSSSSSSSCLTVHVVKVRSIGFTCQQEKRRNSSPRSGFALGDDLPTYPALQLPHSSRRMLACLPIENPVGGTDKSTPAKAAQPRLLHRGMSCSSSWGVNFLSSKCVSVSAAPEHHPMNGKALITQRSAGRCNGCSRFAMERACEP
jgi:hypothetical protein